MYLLIGKAFAGTGIGPAGYYITCQQNTVVRNIATHPIYDIAVTEESMSGSLAILNWWKHSGVQFGYLKGAGDKLELDMED